MLSLFENNVSGAFISDCHQYRYSLSRVWDESKPMVMFLMLNPSTADALQDDPTIRRCIGFAKSWGYGGLYVGNLFAFRATNPKELLKAEDPIGKDNIQHLKEMFDKSNKIIAAWGNSKIVNKLLKEKDDYVPLKGRKAFYIELSVDGTPKHPLYLKKELLPQPFESTMTWK